MHLRLLSTDIQNLRNSDINFTDIIMAKKESTLVNMALTLFVVSAVAALALGFVNKITIEPIEKAKAQKLESALRQVLPEFNLLKEEKVVPNAKITESIFKKPAGADTLFVYKAYYNDTYVGAAVKSFSDKGFSGRIYLMVGFDATNSIFNISVLEHKETPGLGDKMEKAKSNWSLQFNNKNPEEFILRVRKDDGHVDAITASTISSRAYCEAVERAYNTVKEIEK